MNYIFFGTPSFAVIILEALIEAGYLPTLVVTAPDKPKGRGRVLTSPPVKLLAQEHRILVIQPSTLKNNNEIKKVIATIQPDLFIVAAYGKIIPKTLFDIPQKGGLNVHPSLLPKYRGPSPIQAAILNGDKETGVTIMLMDEEMDHGPILAQRELGISNFQFLISKLTAKELSEKLAYLGAELLIETIPKWLADTKTAQKQDHSKAIYTKMITKEDGRIDWHKSAEEIERMVRAYTPWPSAWTMGSNTKCLTQKMRIKILKSRILRNLAMAENRSISPGSVIKQNSDLSVACGNDFLIIEKLQMESRKPLSGAEFMRGYGVKRFYYFDRNERI